MGRTLLVGVTVWLSACGGDASLDPVPDPLTIRVTGVEPYGRYADPVTIGISASRGRFEARVDGSPFAPGGTVSGVGVHRLEVDARDGSEAASLEIHFELVQRSESHLIVRVFDLGDNEAGGGGDAILLTDSTATGLEHALVDAGPAGPEGSRPDHVVGRLRALGVTRLRAVVLTHAHSDHFEGLPAVLDEIRVDRFVYNGQRRGYAAYADLVALAESRADTAIVPTGLLAVPLGGDTGAEVTVIPPLPTYLGDTDVGSRGINEGSLGAVVRSGTFSMFMTGDGEVEANDRWRRAYGGLSGNANVLKAGHHGANDALFDNGWGGGSSWLDHTDPAIVLISANGVTHPRRAALSRFLNRTGTRTYCTHVHGDIELRVSPGGDAVVIVERNADQDCVPGSEATT